MQRYRFSCFFHRALFPSASRSVKMVIRSKTPSTINVAPVSYTHLADGSPAFAMVSTLSGAIANIILDPIFIFIFQWGMMGAAIATVIGQIITAILSVWYIFHMKTIKPAKKHFHLNSRICGRTLLLGITSFLSQISLVAAMAAINNMLRQYGAVDPIFMTKGLVIPL